MYGFCVENGFGTIGFELLLANCDYNNDCTVLDVAVDAKAFAILDCNALVFVGKLPVADAV